MMMLNKYKKIHIIGIGGIGMSSIAEVLLNNGFEISGSDRALNEVTERLALMGVKIMEGHLAENVTGADLVVYSSAVDKNNPELEAARQNNILAIKRPEMLAECMKMKYAVCVAGTHGKTTTTSMTALALIEAGLDPTVIVGGRLNALGGANARYGKSEYIVVEADEYDRTFLKMTPAVAVMTNIEEEHLDIYADLDDIKDSFVEFANKVPFYGKVIACIDEPEVRNVLPRIDRPVLTYGMNDDAQLKAVNIEQNGFSSTFGVEYLGQLLGEIKLNLPGIHFVKNALAAIAVNLELGLGFEHAAKALAQFTGVQRRFEIKYNDEILVVDDYAHHPSEVKATLSGIKKGFRNRLVAVFQPHLYSRTRDFYREFAEVFGLADVFICLDVYPSRELPIEGISGRLITDEALRLGHTNVIFESDKSKIPALLNQIKQDGDIILTLGAGDITKIGEEFVKMLKK